MVVHLDPCASSSHADKRAQRCYRCNGKEAGRDTNFVVDALIEQHTKRPPVCTSVIALAGIYFRCEVRQSSGLAGQDLAWYNIGGNILPKSLLERGMVNQGG